jgi:hypothetical protein
LTADREPIYCDCHGDEVMAFLSERKLIIRQRRHGADHWVSIHIDKLLERIENKDVEVRVT